MIALATNFGQHWLQAHVIFPPEFADNSGMLKVNAKAVLASLNRAFLPISRSRFKQR